jgi:cytochrome c oxidase subunit 4
MEEKEKGINEASAGTYCYIWLSLLLLTVITVSVACLHLGNLSILAAVGIASIKASLVLNIFMNLRYEKRIFKVMVFVAIATLTVFIGLTFIDVLYR